MHLGNSMFLKLFSTLDEKFSKTNLSKEFNLMQYECPQYAYAYIHNHTYTPPHIHILTYTKVRYPYTLDHKRFQFSSITCYVYF